jgi:hypothetical protein
MMRSCQKRCIQETNTKRHLEESEKECVDTCVQKYLKVHASVGQSVQKINQQ